MVTLFVSRRCELAGMRTRCMPGALSIHGCRMYRAATVLVVLLAVGCHRDEHAWAERGFSGDGQKLEGNTSDCSESCSHIPQIGKTVAEMKVAAPAPTPQGGTLTAGTYVATEMTEYTGPGGATGPTGTERAFTLRIGAPGSSTPVDVAYVHAADACKEYQQSGTLETWGIWMKVALRCWTEHPTPQEVVQAYTATDDTLIVFPGPSSTMKFVRQR